MTYSSTQPATQPEVHLAPGQQEGKDPAALPLVLPEMGCGTWAWGNRLLWNYAEEIDGELKKIFNYCVYKGITLFDSGDSYGTGRLTAQSEKLLGQFYQTYSGPKNHVCLATKLAAYPWRLTRGSMVAAGDASAERLGQIDLVQLHWSTANYAPWQEQPLINGLGDLYEQGKVKAVGLSNFGPRNLKRVHKHLAERGIPITTLQVQYSLLSTYAIDQLNLKETCDELGIRIIAYSPLTLGLLTGKYSMSGSMPKGVRGILFKQLLPGIQPVLNTLREIAFARKKTMAQVALNWCMCKGTLPIPGAKTVDQAVENAGA